MLDAIDAMLYALVLTHVMRFGNVEGDFGAALHTDSAGIADGQRKF